MTITGPCTWVKPYHATRTGYEHVIEVDLIADYVARVKGEINRIQTAANARGTKSFLDYRLISAR